MRSLETEHRPLTLHDDIDPETEAEAVRKRDEKEIQNDYKKTGDGENQGREIEHLILVTHGIGQRLGMRYVRQYARVTRLIPFIFAAPPLYLVLVLVLKFLYFLFSFVLLLLFRPSGQKLTLSIKVISMCEFNLVVEDILLVLVSSGRQEKRLAGRFHNPRPRQTHLTMCGDAEILSKIYITDSRFAEQRVSILYMTSTFSARVSRVSIRALQIYKP